MIELARGNDVGLILAIATFTGAFAILLKSADYFVSGAVGISDIFRIPKVVVGIVLVGLATSSPELAVSVQAAYLGHPEIALGNGIGSVVANNGLALALAAMVASSIVVDRRILKSFALFLICVAFLSYILALNAFIARIEGLLLLSLLAGYYYYLVRKGGSDRRQRARKTEASDQKEKATSDPKLKRIVFLFIIGAAGVIVSSRLIIWSSLWIAEFFKVPEVILGLTMIAVGTSLPEISTAIVSVRKGHGELAVGNVLGADILNILLIIGAAATVNPIRVNPRTITFAYPWMLFVVVVMVLLMRHRYKLTRIKGVLLLLLYAVYLFQLVKWVQG